MGLQGFVSAFGAFIRDARLPPEVLRTSALINRLINVRARRIEILARAGWHKRRTQRGFQHQRRVALDAELAPVGVQVEPRKKEGFRLAHALQRDVNIFPGRKKRRGVMERQSHAVIQA